MLHSAQPHLEGMVAMVSSLGGRALSMLLCCPSALPSILCQVPDDFVTQSQTQFSHHLLSRNLSRVPSVVYNLCVQTAFSGDVVSDGCFPVSPISF